MRDRLGVGFVATSVVVGDSYLVFLAQMNKGEHMKKITFEEVQDQTQWVRFGEDGISGHFFTDKGDYWISIWHRSTGGYYIEVKFGHPKRIVMSKMHTMLDRAVWKAYDAIETHHNEFGTEERPDADMMLEFVRNLA